MWGYKCYRDDRGCTPFGDAAKPAKPIYTTADLDRAQAQRTIAMSGAEHELEYFGDPLEPIIWTDPRRMGGIPCVYGTRVPVDDVLRLISECTDEETSWYYPSVTPAQVARLRAGNR